MIPRRVRCGDERNRTALPRERTQLNTNGMEFGNWPQVGPRSSCEPLLSEARPFKATEDWVQLACFENRSGYFALMTGLMLTVSRWKPDNHYAERKFACILLAQEFLFGGTEVLRGPREYYARHVAFAACLRRYPPNAMTWKPIRVLAQRCNPLSSLGHRLARKRIVRRSDVTAAAQASASFGQPDGVPHGVLGCAVPDAVSSGYPGRLPMLRSSPTPASAEAADASRAGRSVVWHGAPAENHTWRSAKQRSPGAVTLRSASVFRDQQASSATNSRR